MALQPNDAKLVKDSWAKVKDAFTLDQVGNLFYKNLFETAPAAKALFKDSDMSKQPQRLMEMVDAAIKLLDNPGALIPVLKELGERHGAYGTQEAHYPIVGNALIITLKQGLGAAFTKDVEGAWGRVYGLIQSTMIEGGNTPRGKELFAKWQAKHGGSSCDSCCYLKCAVAIAAVGLVAYYVMKK